VERAIKKSMKIISIKNRNIKNQNGAFTLIEVLVSVSIFALVMLVATGSVFSIVQANKKTHTLKSVMTNLNFALESVTRDLRVGTRYICDNVGDCQSGGTVLRYKANRDVDGDGVYVSGDAIEYSLASGRIMKRVYGTIPSTLAITAEEITIESMMFYVTGTGSADSKQPKAVMTIQGYAGVGTTRSDFNIQTTISQRAIDS
jgi:prepilin-type N-terminal cleavage/methylation domain-containing protein